MRIPAGSDLFLHRPRLVELLNRAVGRQVTLVTGPAGTGKTLAVADWCRQGTAGSPIVWLSLAREDCHPPRLWKSLLDALLTGLGPAAFRDLELPDAPDVEMLGRLLSNLGTSLVVVLDDLQELDEGASLDWLDQLLRWPPDGMRFVLISRHDPPINLHRLRLEDRLTQLQFSDLAFSQAESRDVLAIWGLALDEPALERLVDATGGWIAAIRLAALTLSASDDPAALLERFAGPTFLIADFLWHDVLGMLPEDEAEFLLRSSVSARLCGPLAAALTGVEAAGEVLRALARNQFLTHELEGTAWYRTHTLLRKALLARLHTDRPTLARELHRTAALWFEEHRVWGEAVDHAISSGDWDFAGRIIARSGVPLCLGADAVAFADLMARVPEAHARDHPELAVGMAFAAESRGDRSVVNSFLALAETGLGELPEPRRSTCALAAQLVRARQAYAGCDAIAMRRSMNRAEQLLTALGPSDAPGWVHHQASVRAMRGVAELWAGWHEDAGQILRSGLASVPPDQARGAEYLGLSGLLALAEAGVGMYSAARRTALSTIETARGSGRAHAEEGKWAWLALAYVDTYSLGEDAAATIRQCAALVGAHPCPFSVALLRIVQAAADAIGGDLAGARRRLAAAAAGPAGRGGLIASYLVSFRVMVELATGNIDRARDVMGEYDLASAHETAAPASARADLVSLPRAQLLLTLNKPEQVRSTVAHRLAEGGGRGAGAWLLVALAEEKMRHDLLAAEAMSRAIELAAAQRMAYLFLRPTPNVRAMLRRHLVVDGSHREFVEAVLAREEVTSTAGSRCAMEPLTERERSVLIYLPTMAANIEIADALSISENTVKQHLKSIYRKLGVHNRREAARAARDHGLTALAQLSDPVGR